MEKVSYIEQLVNYVKKNLKRGYTKESLKWALVRQGYSKLEIEKALTIAEKEMSKEVPILGANPSMKQEIVEPKIEDIKVEKKEPFWKRWFG